MEADIRILIQELHDSPIQLVLVVAGAGTGALAHLLSVGGASRTLIEALVPYSQSSFDEFLGQQPEQYVSGQTACLAAGRAYTRARWLSYHKTPVLGVACSATIATDRTKRGEHRAHIAIWSPSHIYRYQLDLEKGARDRAAEEALVSQAIYHGLATAAHLQARPKLPLGDGDKLQAECQDLSKLGTQLAQAEIDYFGIQDDGTILLKDDTPKAAHPQVIVSGSFNPLHQGHLGMGEAASTLLQCPVAFELSASNVDKPPLPTATVLDRAAQFAGRYSIFVSNAPTYVQKARLYPGTTFVIGYDTAIRIFVPKYYQNSQEQMLAAVEEIRDLGCRFLVAGRVDDTGIFRSLTDVEIPAQFIHLFDAIPEENFRMDVSSSALRKGEKRGSR